MSKYVKTLTDLIFENRYLHYNTEEKHHFVSFKILDVLFRRAQQEYDNPHDFYDAPFTAAERYSNKKSTA